MRAIPITKPGFVPSSDALEATDEADRTEHTGFESNDVGKICRQLDAGTRWRITAVQSGSATWEQVLGGTAAPSNIGTANAAGSAATAAASDHVHAHGVQTDATLHASASASAAGFMTAASYKKAVGIGMSNWVTVPAGSGTKEITTTEALLAAKNTSMTGRFVIVFWKSLDQTKTRSGEIEFAIAWHDDDTQTIEQSNVSDNSDSGATPTITVAVHGVNVVLLLNANHTVTVSLTRDATYARGCKVRYHVEETIGQAIIPATFQSATTDADGDAIALTFDVALDEGSVPDATAFTLHGTTATIASVGISTVTVTLTLTGNVAYGETVTWDYVAPEENPLLADGDGGPVASASGLACTNAVPPSFVSGITDDDGNKITLTWAGALDEESTPDAGDFSLAGTSATVASVLVSGATVELTLTTANVAYGESPTVSYTQGETSLQSAEGNAVEDLTTEAVTNAVPPSYSSSTSNNAGDQIVMTWAGALNESNVPDPGDFTLAGTSATVLSVGVSGTDVTLTLETALVEYGETPTVSYTAGSTPIQSAEGYQVVDLTTESVTNVTPPDLVSIAASADGSAIVAMFEGNLDAGSEPAIGAFALSGTTATLDSVTSISGTDLTLALTGNIAYDESPLLSYTKPGENPLQENTTGYDCISFADQAVTNEVPPVLVSLATNALGTEILMTYSAALDEASVPATGDFAIGGDDATVHAVYVSGTGVRIELDGAIEYGDSPTVDYTAGSNPIQDAVEGYNVADLSAEACDNAVPPGYSSGTTDALGTTITLTWAGALDEESEPAPECFGINGNAATVASINVSGSTCVLTLSGIIVNGDTITVDYVVPESNPLQSAEGYELASLTAAAVTNATAPLLLSAESDATGATIDLTYNVALDEASIPAITAYVLAGTSAVVDTGGVAISGAVVTLTLDQPLVADETVLLDYTVPGENPVQDAAGAASAAALDDQSVGNNAAPLFVSAASDALGETVILTYDCALDEASVPAIAAYTLGGTSSVVDTDGVAVTGSTVVLTLDQPLVADETVTVSYVVPGSGKVQSAVGQVAAVALTTESVTNATGPLFVSATTDATGATIVLTYDVSLDESSVPAITAYTLGGTSSVVDTDGVGISGAAITLTLDTPIIAGETVVVSYAVPEENMVQSAVTNAAAALLTTEAATNITAPLFVSGETSVGGDEIYLTFDSSISETTIDHTAFAINGDDATPAGATASGAVVTVTLTGVIENGDTITVDYTKPVADYLKAAGGDYPVLTDTGWSIVNNVPA